MAQLTTTEKRTVAATKPTTDSTDTEYPEHMVVLDAVYELIHSYTYMLGNIDEDSVQCTKMTAVYRTRLDVLLSWLAVHDYICVAMAGDGSTTCITPLSIQYMRDKFTEAGMRSRVDYAVAFPIADRAVARFAELFSETNSAFTPGELNVEFGR
jgi:hypothetical protein